MDQGSTAPTAGSPSELAGVMGSTPASGGGTTAAPDGNDAGSMSPQQRMAAAKLLASIAQSAVPQQAQQARMNPGYGPQYSGGPGMVNTGGGR